MEQVNEMPGSPKVIEVTPEAVHRAADGLWYFWDDEKFQKFGAYLDEAGATEAYLAWSNDPNKPQPVIIPDIEENSDGQVR